MAQRPVFSSSQRTRQAPGDASVKAAVPNTAASPVAIDSGRPVPLGAPSAGVPGRPVFGRGSRPSVGNSLDAGGVEGVLADPLPRGVEDMEAQGEADVNSPVTPKAVSPRFGRRGPVDVDGPPAFPFDMDESDSETAARPRFGTAAPASSIDLQGPPGIVFDDEADTPTPVFVARAEPGELLSSTEGRPRFGSGGARVGAKPAGLDTQEIVGRLDNLRTINDWAVGTIWHPERRQLKITGTGLGELVEGLEYLFVGYPKTHPQHGEHLEVVAATPHISPKPMAITLYISNCFTGIGLAKADKYVKSVLAAGGQEALEALRQQLINDPYSLDLTELAENAQFRPKGAGSDDEVDLGLGRQSVVFRELATRLGGVPGMKANVLKSLATWLISKHGPYEGGRVPSDLAERCWATLALNPYEPMKEVVGYAWASAEAIGREVRVPRELPRRLSALVEHALGLGCTNGGHAYLSPRELHGWIMKLDSRIDPSMAMEQAISDGFVVLDEKGRAYRPEILRAETRLAQGIAELLVPGEPLMTESKDVVDQRISDMAKQLGIGSGLDTSQLDAVSRILRSSVRIHTLTGGPGCGKTTVMEVLAKMLPGKDIVFATPTGKSAKVLHARVAKHGLSVATLHSTLGCQGEDVFTHGPDEPLEADGFVIDESSMPDLVLSDAAVAALADGAHLVLVGDPEQLESIGPGRVLKDILQLEGVDHNRLSKTHRNGGQILALVDSIRHGDIDFTEDPSVQFSHGLSEAAAQVGDVASAYLDAVERSGFENVMLLMSRRKGDVDTPGWNATYANGMLRQLCNPNGKKIAGTNFHVGDRIIIRERMGLEQRGSDGDADPSRVEVVVNGDVGTIRDVAIGRKTSGLRASLLPKWIDVDLDDGRTVNMPGACVNSIGHAYALTVHSAQGSEYKEVILVATPGHASFVNRTMLLTGVSRTRDQLRVFANDEDLRKIAATPSPSRNTALVERILAFGECQTSREGMRMRA